MRQLTLQQKLDMANKTAHGLMQEVDEQKKKQKALADENDQLKSKVKELSEEKLTNDAVIIVKERELKTYEDAISEYRLDGRKMLARIKSLEITILEKDNKIRKLTNDLEEAKLNNSAPQPKAHGTPIPNLPEGVSGVMYGFGEVSFPVNVHSAPDVTGKLTRSSVPLSEIMQRLKEPKETAAQKILNILKQLEPERMVFEFSQVFKEVSRIIADNKAKSASVSELFNKI
jgi:uncharacterized protein YqeY